MSATSTDTCPATWLDLQLGGGLAKRSSLAITDVVDDSLSIKANTGTSNCNAWAAGAAAPGVIMVNVAGYWYNNQYRPYATFSKATATKSSSVKQCPTHITLATETIYEVQHKTCDGDKFPQACAHYSSVISRAGGAADLLKCLPTDVVATSRKLPAAWDVQHKSNWFKGYTQKNVQRSCERDEYPPYLFDKGTSGKGAGWIRFLPWKDNNGAGKLWRGVCQKKYYKSSKAVNGGGVNLVYQNGVQCIQTTTYTSPYSTYPAMSMHFEDMDDELDDDLPNNGCWPEPTVPSDYGFVLFWQDEWYAENILRVQQPGEPATADYGKEPGTYTKGIKKISKRQPRWTDDIDPNMIFVEHLNTTRRATKEELEEHFGVVMCETEYCDEELRVRGLPSRRPNELILTADSAVKATAAGRLSSAVSRPTQAGSFVSIDAKAPVMTASPVFKEWVSEDGEAY